MSPRELLCPPARIVLALQEGSCGGCEASAFPVAMELLFGAAAAGGGGLFSYNRENYMFDKEGSVEQLRGIARPH